MSKTRLSKDPRVQTEIRRKVIMKANKVLAEFVLNIMQETIEMDEHF